MKDKTVLGITLYKLIGISLFLILLRVLNVIDLDSLTSLGIVEFLNQNLIIIIIFTLLFYFGELSFLFRYPFNILGPLFNAFGAVFLAEFIFHIFYMFGDLLDRSVFFEFRFLEPLILNLVFFIVLILGYFWVFGGFDRKTRGQWEERGELHKSIKGHRKEEAKRVKAEKRRGSVDWGDVGYEFKMAVYNMVRTVRKRFEVRGKRK